jgi:hypothetical protein
VSRVEARFGSGRGSPLAPRLGTRRPGTISRGACRGLRGRSESVWERIFQPLPSGRNASTIAPSFSQRKSLFFFGLLHLMICSFRFWVLTTHREEDPHELRHCPSIGAVGLPFSGALGTGCVRGRSCDRRSPDRSPGNRRSELRNPPERLGISAISAEIM